MVPNGVVYIIYYHVQYPAKVRSLGGFAIVKKFDQSERGFRDR